jgi:Concanavalin A-like lectin/glucanases superfamily
MPFPSFLKVAVEFGTLYSEVWTDITHDVDTSSSASIKFGRTKATGAPVTATLNLRLSNALGNYTPGRQVQANGTTAHLYYPNILPDKRIKVYWLISSVEYRRFTGFIDQWLPGLENGVRAYVDITASDITGRLANVTLQSPMQQQILFDGPPAAYWPLTDASGSTQAAESSGNGYAPLTVTLTGAGTASMLTFGANGPGAGDGTGVAFAATSTNAAILASPGDWLGPGGTVTASSAWSVELWVQSTTAPSVGFPQLIYSYSLSSVFGPLAERLSLQNDGTIHYTSQAGDISSAGSFVDGGWHHVVTTYNGAAGTAQLYIDNILQGTLTSGSGSAGSVGAFYVGGQYRPAGLILTGVDFIGGIGYVAGYNTVVSSTMVTNHYNAGRGFYGDSSDTRIKRVLAYAGLTSAQWNIDGGWALVGTYPQAGKSALQYCQDMATTEGGGSVFYATPDGLCRFTNRYYRQPAAPVLTVDAQKDLINSSYLPSLDKTNLQNQVVISRSGESGTLSTQVFTVSTGYQLASQPLTTYATNDLDALANGQQIVAQNSQPGFRFPQVGISVLTSVNDLTLQVAAVQIGSRTRLGNIPPGKAPGTQTDVLVEGWTETFTNASYNWVADTSPADNPAAGIYDDTTYGRYSAAGTCTLTSTITAAATALSITTTAGNPTFTTTSGHYPLKIQINEEVIQLNSPPGGSSSPQSFTGVTRGSSGTPAAPQTAGSQLDVWPLATYTI